MVSAGASRWQCSLLINVLEVAVRLYEINVDGVSTEWVNLDLVPRVGSIATRFWLA